MQTLPRPKRVAIRPLECLQRGFASAASDPLTFAGVGALVALGAMVPFGLLLGPFLAGAHLFLMDHRRRSAPGAGRVFDGLQDFVQAWLAIVLHMVASMVVVFGCYAFFFVCGMLAFGLDLDHAVVVALEVAAMSVLFLVMIALYVPFGFAPGLVAERRLSGLDAVRVSARAARLNFGGLFALWLLMYALCFAGLLLCVVPFFFVFPACLAALFEAFRRVFGEELETPAPADDPLAP